MDFKWIGSLSLLCCEATGELGNHDLPGAVETPVGTHPAKWDDGMHNRDGHLLRSAPGDKSGEKALIGELGALMASQGVQYAYNDVTNAHLDDKLVREARELAMNVFKDMGVNVTVPRADKRKCNEKIIKTR